MSAADYLAAVRPDLRALAGRSAPSPWDPALAEAMAETGVGVEEEVVADQLVTDLDAVALNAQCSGPSRTGATTAKFTKQVVQNGPATATMGPVVRIQLERVEALELLAMTLAHLNDAEARAEVSPRLPLLMAIRDKLASALREES